MLEGCGQCTHPGYEDESTDALGGEDEGGWAGLLG